MDATAAFYQALAESEAEDAALAKAARAEGVPETADPADSSETYEFRWDVEVPGGERRYGQKFMKQWKRILQVQKLSPLVSAISAHHARFQVCIGPEETLLANAGAARYKRRHRRRCRLRSVRPKLPKCCRASNGLEAGLPLSHIDGEPARRHPAGWQGVRVWMTFARRDVEAVLGKNQKYKALNKDIIGQ